MKNRILELLDGRPVTWLAKKTGIPRTTLNNYIFEKSKATIDNAYLIADAFDVDIKDVFPPPKNSHK